MLTPPRLTLGIAFVVALSLFAACQQTPARAAAAPPKRAAEARAPSSPAEARGAAAPADADEPVAPAPVGWDDSDSDGIPDREELRTFGDRESFREWFTEVAEQQFYEPSGEWNAGQRDCAGLVRFAWREALRAHDRAWFLRMGEAYDPVAPDVRAYTLERSPVGERLFRATAGSFDVSNLRDGTFSEFADARTLKE